MLKLPLVSHNMLTYSVAICALIALPVLVTLLLCQQRFEAIALGDYFNYRCQTGANIDAPAFDVLTLTAMQSPELADQLCANAAISARFSSVSITWHPRAFLTAEHILEGQFDLFWNRHHVVNGLVPDASAFYRSIVDTPRYTLYWVSRNGPPELSADYLRDKTIGFSRDQHSQSFYLRPMAALKAAEINLNDEQKRFYPGVAALMEGFRRGEVDIISSLRSNLSSDDENLYYTVLDKNVPSGSWFLRRSPLNDALACDLAALLLHYHDPVHGQTGTITADECR